jgi:hypothetical protein
MAEIKIILEGDEVEEDVKDELAKAFISQHMDPKPKQFQDPTLREIDKQLNEKYLKMLEEMMAEIELEIKRGR